MYSESKYVVPEEINDLDTEITEKSNEIRAEEAISYYDRIFSSYLASFRNQLKRIKDLKDDHTSSVNLTSLYDAFKANHDKSASVLAKLRTAFKSKLFICPNQTNKVDIYQEFCDFEVEVLNMKEGKIDAKETVVLYDHLISLLIVSAQIVIKIAFEVVSSGGRFDDSNSYQDAMSSYKKAILLQVILKKTLDSIVTTSPAESEIKPEINEIIPTSVPNTLKMIIDQCGSTDLIPFEKKVVSNSSEEPPKYVVQQNLIDSNTKLVEEDARSGHILSKLLQKQKFFTRMITSLESNTSYSNEGLDPVEAEVSSNHLCSLYQSFIHNQIEISANTLGTVLEKQMEISEDVQKKVIFLQTKLKRMITSNKSSTPSIKCDVHDQSAQIKQCSPNDNSSSRLVTSNLKRPAEPIESVTKSKIRILMNNHPLSSGPSEEIKSTKSSSEKIISRFDKSTQTEALLKSVEQTKILSPVVRTTPSLQPSPKVSKLRASGFPYQSSVNSRVNKIKLKSLANLAQPIVNGQLIVNVTQSSVTSNQTKIFNTSASSNRASAIKLPKLSTKIVKVPKVTTLKAGFSSLSTHPIINVQPNKTTLPKSITFSRSPISLRSRLKLSSLQPKQSPSNLKKV